MTNEELLGSILSLLAVDGKLNKHEMRFFDEVCERLEVSQEQKETVIARIKQGKGSVHLPEDEADKKRLLYFLAQAVVADGVVAPQERHVLDAVVTRLGIGKAYVERFIEGRLEEIKRERYTRSDRKAITCPKCGHEQPESHQCRRCGIIFEKYKQVKGPSDEDKLRELFASSQ
jgi:uncharacterized tellurite resistance protein B-like protein